MHKIYEYLCILLYFYSNEHEPIHVHGKHGDTESKAEFIIVNGEIVEIRIKTVKGYKPLKGKELKDFKDFLKTYASKIVDKWIDYFVLHKNINFERINTKLK